MTVLSPYCVAVVLVAAIFWMSEGIVGSNDHKKEPGNDGEDLVGNQVVAGELFPFGKGIVCRCWSARNVPNRGGAVALQFAMLTMPQIHRCCSLQIASTPSSAVSLSPAKMLDVRREEGTGN
jgi:hypothetical protein